jgi:hypothetical protein
MHEKCVFFIKIKLQTVGTIFDIPSNRITLHNEKRNWLKTWIKFTPYTIYIHLLAAKRNSNENSSDSASFIGDISLFGKKKLKWFYFIIIQ